MSRTCISAAVLLLLVAPLGAGSALADETVTKNDNKSGLSNFTVRNETDQAIVEAHARTKSGKSLDFTGDHGAIPSRHGQNFPINNGDCLESMRVKMKDGRTLSQDNLNACTSPRLVVRANEITLESGAGGPLHVTGGHDEIPGKSPPVPSQQRFPPNSQ